MKCSRNIEMCIKCTSQHKEQQYALIKKKNGGGGMRDNDGVNLTIIH
jgi:hypothetical protein